MLVRDAIVLAEENETYGLELCCLICLGILGILVVIGFIYLLIPIIDKVVFWIRGNKQTIVQRYEDKSPPPQVIHHYHPPPPQTAPSPPPPPRPTGTPCPKCGAEVSPGWDWCPHCGGSTRRTAKVRKKRKR